MGAVLLEKAGNEQIGGRRWFGQFRPTTGDQGDRILGVGAAHASLAKPARGVSAPPSRASGGTYADDQVRHAGCPRSSTAEPMSRSLPLPARLSSTLAGL
jgi:hypothetical protein